MLTQAHVYSLTKQRATEGFAMQEEAVRLIEGLFIAIGRQVT